jgi:tetratricopeptide (TPR) repeat protein
MMGNEGLGFEDMDETAKKEISVIVRLDNLSILNGGLPDLRDDGQFDTRLRTYLVRQFGPSAETIQVARNREKIKLTWQLPNYVQEANNQHEKAPNHSREKQYSEAISSWVKAITLNPGDPDFYFNLGIAFFEIRNYTEATENLRKAIDICPIFYKAHLILGTVYLKTRKFDDAEYHLKTSIAFQSQHALAYLNLGAVYSILKRYDEGIRMFRKGECLFSAGDRHRLDSTADPSGQTRHAGDSRRRTRGADTSGHGKQ